MVYFVINKYVDQTNIDYDDYIGEGMLYLVKAAKTFDHTKGYAFTTYASKCIQNGLFTMFRKNKIKTTELDETFVNIIPANQPPLDDLLISNDMLDKLIVVCDKHFRTKTRNIYKQVLYNIVYRQYTEEELGKKLGISRNYVAKITACIRKLARKLYLEEM